MFGVVAVPRCNSDHMHSYWTRLLFIVNLLCSSFAIALLFMKFQREYLQTQALRQCEDLVPYARIFSSFSVQN